MPLSESEFKTWLGSSNALRCVLVEIQVNNGVSEQTLYLSNKNYVTSNSGFLANTTYLPVLSSSVEFTENINMDGSASLSYGDLEIDNNNGQFDHWIDYVWAGRTINIFIGDVRSSRDSFNQIFAGVVNDIAFSSAHTINISIRDTLQRLNTPVTDVVLGPYGTKGANNVNKDAIRPLVFGEVHNITPLLIDDSLLEYMVHDGPIESIIEVRDNGVPVQFTPNLSTGTFTLVNNPVGTITCSVQGDNRYVDASGITVTGYRDTVAKLIQRIITGFGKPTERILSSEMDLTAINSFDSLHQQAVGIYISDRENILEVCQKLASSVGARLVGNRLGLLSLVKLTAPTANSVSIKDVDMYQNSFSIRERVPVQGSVKLNYCKNWTVQSDLTTGLVQEHKDMFTKEFLAVTVTDLAVKTKYKLSEEPVAIDTCFISNIGGEVSAEATRRLNIFKTPRTIYQMELVPQFLDITLGDMVTITYHRFGLSAGKAGQVVSISIDWDTATIRIGVFV